MSTRRLYALGSAHVPETAPQTRGGSLNHPCLEAVWNQCIRSGRLWYAPSRQGKWDGPPGTCFALYALKYAVRGTECEGMDQRISHVASLDSFFVSRTDSSKPVGILRVTGCGAVRLMLLTDGTLITLSERREWHGQLIKPPQIATTIVDAAAGEGHYALCDSTGALYTWGWNNEFGQLGRGSVSHRADRDLIGLHQPQPLAGFGRGANATLAEMLNASSPATIIETRTFPNIVAVACGRHHTVALVESRTAVYTFGRGSRGQLGLGRPSKNGGPGILGRIELLPTPRCVPCIFGAKIRELVCACDGDFVMLITDAGSLIVWGDNTTGALGSGTSKSVFIPTVVSLAAHDPTPAITSKIHRPTPPYGSIESYLHPRRIKPRISPVDTSAPRVVLASASLSHSAVVDDAGRLLTTGLRPLRVAYSSIPVNALGALGRKLKSKEEALRFGDIQGIYVDSNDRVVCGDGFTCYLMRRLGLVFLTGSIAIDGQVIVGGGDEAHDMYCLVTGVGKRVVDVFTACDGGLFMLVDDV